MKLNPVVPVGVLAAALAVGCASRQGDQAGPRDVQPADFAVGGQPEGVDPEPHTDLSGALRGADQADEAQEAGAPGAGARPPAEAGPSSPNTGAPIDAGPGSNASQPSTQPSPGESYTMDAMVGQVNGRAIYAQTVLEPVTEQLQALGRQWSRPEFRDRAYALIRARIDQIVADALILGEAERDLNDRERMGLQAMVQRKREELLRQYGQGSVSLAEHTLIEETGKGLDQTLQEYREQVVVQRYLRQKLIPRINVSRRDVERYYNDHRAEFNPPTTRVVRLIRVQSEEEAKQIQAMLDAGQPFEQVAQDKLNLNRPERGGLMDPVVGEKVYENPELNNALLSLKVGQHAGPVPVGRGLGFLYLEKLEQPPQESLREAQLRIERLLREERYRELSAQYRRRLFQEGSYNDIDQMAADLTEVAIARFAPPMQ